MDLIPTYNRAKEAIMPARHPNGSTESSLAGILVRRYNVLNELSRAPSIEQVVNTSVLIRWPHVRQRLFSRYSQLDRFLLNSVRKFLRSSPLTAAWFISSHRNRIYLRWDVVVTNT